MKPIILTAAEARAVLAGSVEIRRVVQSPARNMQREGMEVIKRRAPGDPWYRDCVWSMRGRTGVWGDYTHERFLAMCPYGAPGDRVWVKEAFALHRIHDGTAPSRIGPTLLKGRWYRADGEPEVRVGKWRSPVAMPHWASRLTLEITGVRVERAEQWEWVIGVGRVG
jgi:hypothetical protein